MLNSQQSLALNTAVNGHNVLIMGQAGTGKSHTLKTVYKTLSKQRNVALLCTTGMACLQYADYGAKTVHRKINGRRARIEMSSGKSRWGNRGPPRRGGGGNRGGGRDNRQRRSRSRSPYRGRRSASPYRGGRRSPSPSTRRRSPRYSRSRSPRDRSPRGRTSRDRSPAVRARSNDRGRSPFEDGK